jgi:hypothetical protein
VTVTVPSGAKVNVHGDIGMLAGSATSSTVDTVLVQDGLLTTDSGYQRYQLVNTAPNAFRYASFDQTFAPAAGSHTYGICGAWASGGTPVTFGGDSNSVLQGELVITIVKQ